MLGEQSNKNPKKTNQLRKLEFMKKKQKQKVPKRSPMSIYREVNFLLRKDQFS